MANICHDCLFYGKFDSAGIHEYCNKRRCKVEWDQTACTGFVSDSHSCCLDCDACTPKGSEFYCEVNRERIPNPSAYYCSRFRY